jgi:hypothetical protein
MGQKFVQRHHPPFLSLIAKADRGDLGLGQRTPKQPGGARRVVQAGKPVPGQAVARKRQAEFLGLFAQRAFHRRLARFRTAAGQIPMRRERDPVIIVAQTGQKPVTMDQQQLGAGKS